MIALEELPGWQTAFQETSTTAAYVNIRNFARSLYFQLTFDQEPPTIAPALCSALEETLRVMDLEFYQMV